ncbi:MAG TPA: amino acid ABC transporter substrate-binding protein [Streptosporangiaceae bacterium]|nr:amino acid ABC transporter substrate-binding protein [Streptosporangiaceae bacterium]
MRSLSHRARFLALGTTAVMTSALVAACGGSSPSGSSSQSSPILIGASLSLTGSFSADGQAFQKGYNLWVKDQNAAGGLLGRKVKLVVINDASSPTQAVTNYQTLVNVDHVQLLFGPFSSLLTGPSVQVAHRYGRAFVEGAGGAPSVFATKLSNLFDVSLPVAASLLPLVNYLTSLPANQRPKTAAFPTSNDPFTQPQIEFAQQRLAAAGIKSVYSKVFPAEPTQYKGIADQVAASKADVVVLGSVDVPTIAAFTQAFVQQHYNPKVFIATAGPDQGSAYVNAVGGVGNTEGVMVPNAWFGGSPNPASKTMVAEYISQYGGTASGVNADVAEAYSVGQVMAQAVKATKGVDNAKIITYLHSGAVLNSVQGSVKFDSVGQNLQATAFVFQWQKGTLVQVLPAGTGATAVQFPKTAWGK